VCVDVELPAVPIGLRGERVTKDPSWWSKRDLTQ
jgi:hypothetical protein